MKSGLAGANRRAGDRPYEPHFETSIYPEQGRMGYLCGEAKTRPRTAAAGRQEGGWKAAFESLLCRFRNAYSLWSQAPAGRHQQADRLKSSAGTVGEKRKVA